MEAQPQRLETAIVSIWELKHVDTCCDACPRKARFQAYANGKDFYVCRVHVLRIIEGVDAAVRQARYAPQA